MLPRAISGNIEVIRVLHVDDDPNQFEFIKFFLNQAQPFLEINCVSTPEEVMIELEIKNYDCVVTDFQMPLMNGIELARKIREKHSIPIILYTGQGSEEVAEAAFTVGIDDYLRKEMDPSHYQVLAKRILNVVEKKRTENLYQRVVEGIRDGLCIVSDNKIVYANKIQADVFGAKKIEDIIDTCALDYVHQDSLETAKKRMSEIASGKITPPFLKYKVKKINGDTTEVETLTSIIRYNGKQAFLVLTRDITERLRLENEKMQSEERFKNIIELAPDGIVTVSMKGEVTSVNPAFLKITGYKEKEILGKKFYQMGTLRNIDLKNNLKVFAQIIRGKKLPPVEFVFQYKNGVQGWGEAHLGFIDREGKKELLAIVRDITERKWVEKELSEHSEELKAIAIEKRETETQEERLLWSNHMNSIKGVRLQESLFTIKNSILSLREDPSKIRELLDIMEVTVDSANIQLKDLFENSESIKNQYCEIQSLLNDTVNEIDIPPEYTINIQIEGENTFYLDSNKVKLAIQDLIANSLASMPKGGKIDLLCSTESDRLVIEIRDSSKGLSENETKYLLNEGKYEKNNILYSLEKSQKAIEDQNGSILVNSELGKGTTYTIIIPMDYRNEITTHLHNINNSRLELNQ